MLEAVSIIKKYITNTIPQLTWLMSSYFTRQLSQNPAFLSAAGILGKLGFGGVFFGELGRRGPSSASTAGDLAAALALSFGLPSIAQSAPLSLSDRRCRSSKRMTLVSSSSLPLSSSSCIICDKPAMLGSGCKTNGLPWYFGCTYNFGQGVASDFSRSCAGYCFTSGGRCTPLRSSTSRYTLLRRTTSCLPSWPLASDSATRQALPSASHTLTAFANLHWAFRHHQRIYRQQRGSVEEICFLNSKRRK